MVRSGDQDSCCSLFVLQVESICSNSMEFIQSCKLSKPSSRYFPFKNDSETVPRVVNQFIQQAQKETGMATQAFTQAVVTQAREADSTMLDDDVIEVMPDEDLPGDMSLPIFEVFWQV